MSEIEKLVIGLDVDDHLLATNDHACDHLSVMMGEGYGYVQNLGGYINKQGPLDALVESGKISEHQLHKARTYPGTPIWGPEVGLDRIASWVIEERLIRGLTGSTPYRAMPGAQLGLKTLVESVPNAENVLDFKVVTARPDQAEVRKATMRQLMSLYPQLRPSSSHFIGNSFNGGVPRSTKHTVLESVGAVAFLDDNSKYIAQIQHDERILPVLVGEHPWQDLSELNDRVLHTKDWGDESVELILEGIEQVMSFRNSKLG